MKKQLSDKQIDDLIRALVGEAGADAKTTDEIADSPTLWWGVQRRIADQKARAPWPPANILRRWLTIVVPAAAAIILVASFFMLLPVDSPRRNEIVQAPDVTETTPEQPIAVDLERGITVGLDVNPTTSHAARFTPSRGLRARPKTPRSKESAEIRSEFIALSYALRPDSGQMVRVKVPRSMMVTLGLVAAIERPNGLVDAEVLVGDDGTTHAIRFIR